MTMANKPISKKSLVSVLKAFLKDCYDDPAVEVQHPAAGILRLRVKSDHGVPVYYRIQVVQE